jgi:hypothetical protein
LACLIGAISDSLCFSSPVPGTIRPPRTDNPNLRPMEPQSLIRLTLRRDSIGPQLLEIDNFRPRIFTTNLCELRTSSLPPVYDDVMQQSSVTITLDQQSLPPTYDDFMGRNNVKDRN